MERKILHRLIEWKHNPQRKPLILEGARQVGKTYVLKDIFGAREYENIAYLNLQNSSPEILSLFEGSIEPQRLVDQLELLLHMDIIPGKTLIFFDEIQGVPRALTSLKYFCEDLPEQHVVAAGSLLGIFLHQDASFPVGKVDLLRLEPMDFEEFLWARGEQRLTAHLHSEPGDTLFRSKLMDYLREYMFAGGMPEVVNEWIQRHDIIRTEGMQRSILMSYTRDFSKHVDGTLAAKIRLVFESLPSQFAKANDKFIYGIVKEGARARDYELAIEWLVDAGIVRRVYCVKRGDKMLLKAYIDRSSFKLYFLDIGLFRCLAGIAPELTFQKDAIFDEFNGLMAEQYTLQELAGRDLYYWASEANAEVDFVGQYGSHIIPIEVKSGENVKAKSLRIYREKYSPALAVRMSLKDLSLDDGLLNIPLYESFLSGQLIRSQLLSNIPSENV